MTPSRMRDSASVASVVSEGANMQNESSVVEGAARVSKDAISRIVLICNLVRVLCILSLIHNVERSDRRVARVIIAVRKRSTVWKLSSPERVMYWLSSSRGAVRKSAPPSQKI